MNLNFILPLTTAPQRGENVSGYLRRLCELNGIQNLALFRNALGVGHLSSTTPSVSPWARLAEASLQPISSLTAMQWSKIDAGAVLGLLNFNGFAVQKKYLRTARLRICPTCVRSRSIIRDTWSLYHITACIIHSSDLVDSCDQCCTGSGEPTPLKYSAATRPWSCHCGREFGEIATKVASPEELLVSMAIERSLDTEVVNGLIHHYFNAEIAALPPNDLLTFVETIGVAATTDANKDIPINGDTVRYQNGIVDHSAGLQTYKNIAQAAGRIIANWPDNYQQLLSEIAFRHPSPSENQEDRRAFATKVGRMVLYPRKSVSGVPLKILQKQADDFCASKLNTIRRQRNLATQDACARRVHRVANMSALARDLDLNCNGHIFQKVYRRAIDEISVYGESTETEKLAANLRNSVINYLEQCADSISSCAAAALLEGGSANRQLRGWDHPALLQPIPPSTNLFGKRKISYRLSDTQLVRDRFIALAMQSEPTGTLFEIRRAARVFLKESYTKSEFLVDLLQQQVSLFRIGNPENVFDLCVDIREVENYLMHRDLRHIFSENKFLKLNQLNRVAIKLIENLEPVTPVDMKRFRHSGTVRYRQTEVYDGERFHVSYAYCAEDFIERVLKLNFSANRCTQVVENQTKLIGKG